MTLASPSLAPAQHHAEEKERTIGDALRELGDKLPNRPDLLWLMAALDCYRRDDQPCRDHWERHANLRFKLRDGTDARESTDDYWRRTWNMREKARRIIEGRESWPAELRVWKLYKELRFSAGEDCPAWLDDDNRRARTLHKPKVRRPSLAHLKRRKPR